MTRGLPYSVLVHILGLIMVIVYGNTVSRPPLQSVRTIPFHVVHRSFSAVPAVETAVESVPTTQPTPEPVVQKKPASLPPKEVPVKPPQERTTLKQTPLKTAPQKPLPVAVSDPTPDQSPVEKVPTDPPATAGPRLEGTDVDFPFAWYTTQIESLVDRNWNPPQLGFGRRPQISCVVHFEIMRNGLVGGVSLTTTSGVGVYDREALRAVQASRLPPLPPQYPGARLGVTFIFKVEPES